MSLENKTLRLYPSRNPVSHPPLGDPFYPALDLPMWEMLAKEETIQGYLQGNVDQQALEGIWPILSDVMNTFSLNGMKKSAEETFRRAGLVASNAYNLLQVDCVPPHTCIRIISIEENTWEADEPENNAAERTNSCQCRDRLTNERPV
jgi:hypothetical protein